MADLKDLIVNGQTHLIGDAVYKTHASTVSDDRIATTKFVKDAVDAKTDTKDTAGSGNTDNKIFLVGTTTQTASGTKSYSDSSTWVQNGTLNTSFLNVTKINGNVPVLTDTTYTLSAGDNNGQVKLINLSDNSSINVTVTGINNAAYKGVDTIVTPTSRNLPDSSAVAAYVNSQMVSVLTYKGTIGTGGTTTSLPTNTSVGWVYVVKTAGTYAGKACEPGDYILCQTTTASAGNNDWDIVTGENQITFGNPTLAAPGSSVSYVTSEGTTYYIKTPSTWKVTDTVYVHPGKTATIATSSSTLQFGSSFKAINAISCDASGHITGYNVSTLTLPNETTLSLSTHGAGNAITSVSINGHNIDVSFDSWFLTEDDIPSLSLTSHSDNASTRFISAISVNEHDIDVSYSNIPTASKNVLGLVKTTSTTVSTTGLIATPIIDGVPYYKDTNTTYSINASAPISVSNQGTTFTISHLDSGVIAGTYGDANSIPQIVVNSTGHITSLSTSAIQTLSLSTHGTGNAITTISVNGHKIDVSFGQTFVTTDEKQKIEASTGKVYLTGVKSTSTTSTGYANASVYMQNGGLNASSLIVNNITVSGTATISTAKINNLQATTSTLTNATITNATVSGTATISTAKINNLQATTSTLTNATITNATVSTATISTLNGSSVPNNPVFTDTKNTAGATTVSDTKLYLIGTTVTGANPITNVNEKVYIGTNNKLYSNDRVVVNEEDLETTVQEYLQEHQNTIVEGPNIKITTDSTELPDGYVKVKYIESNGGAYINTGLVPTDNTQAIIDIYSNTTGSFYVIGARQASGTSIIYASSGSQTGSVITAVFNGSSIRVETNGESWQRKSSGQRYLINIATDNGTGYYNIYDYTNDRYFSSSKAYTPIGTTSVPICVLGFNSSNILSGNSKLYRCEIYQNEVLAFRGIPCYRTSDGVYGLYDVVTNTFKTSATSTQFTGSTEISDTLTISAIDTKAIWGNISGSISNQADLSTALDNKANVSHSHSLTVSAGSGNVVTGITGTFTTTGLTLTVSKTTIATTDEKQKVTSKTSGTIYLSGVTTTSDTAAVGYADPTVYISERILTASSASFINATVSGTTTISTAKINNLQATTSTLTNATITNATVSTATISTLNGSSVPNNPVFIDTTTNISTGNTNGHIKWKESSSTSWTEVKVKGIKTAAFKEATTSITVDSLALPDASAVAAYVSSQMVSALTYKGTVGQGGTTTSLPATHKQGDVWVCCSTGTYAGKLCEPGDYIICNSTNLTTDAAWDAITGENQISFKNLTLATPGSSVSYVTAEGINHYITTPSGWKVTDEKVKQDPGTGNNAYPVLTTPNVISSGSQTTTSYYQTGLRVNPQQKSVMIGDGNLLANSSAALVIGITKDDSSIIATYDGIGNIVNGFVDGTQSYIKSNGQGSIAHGYASGYKNGIYCNNDGAFAGGRIIGGMSEIYANGAGGIATGDINGAGSYITVGDNGAIAHGSITGNGSRISANSEGANAYGYISRNDSRIVAEGAGSHAHGYISRENSYITSAAGAVAYGYCDSSMSYIVAEEGNTAHGYTKGHQSFIESTGGGAIAHGITLGEDSYIATQGGGAIASGIAEGNEESYIFAKYEAAIANGYTKANGSYIFANNYAAIAHGYTLGSGTYVKANGSGSIAHGVIESGALASYILSNSSSAIAAGYINKDNTYISASGAGSIAIGYNGVHANKIGSQAFGSGTIADGNYSHAEGWLTVASSTASHAGGIGTIADQEAMTAIGKYNKEGINNAIFALGIGTSDSSRKNAQLIITNGSTYIYGVGGYDGTQTDLSSVQDLASVISSNEAMESITWSALKDKRDSSLLIPGKQYRITDYTCTTTQADTSSAGHVFDVIVVADSIDTINENARAIQHEGDDYFTNSNLKAWELKYDIDNDTTKYAWADATNGKGVIYWMKDEWENECPYDFKNIQMDLDHIFQYTFNMVLNDGIKDYSLNSDIGRSSFCICNKIYYSYDEREGNFIIPHNIFIAPEAIFAYNILEKNCRFNRFIGNSFNNTFGNDCHNNMFLNDCYSNTFGNVCSNNIFGSSCYYNTFGNVCGDNTFGDNCYNNTFGNDCYNNTFGNSCYNNTFGTGCYYNTFGNSCYNNTFVGDCNHIKFGISGSTKSFYQYIIVENGNQYIYLNCSGTTSYSNYYRNVKICQGVNNTTTYKTITDANVNQTYQTVYQPANTQVISV